MHSARDQINKHHNAHWMDVGRCLYVFYSLFLIREHLYIYNEYKSYLEACKM